MSLVCNIDSRGKRARLIYGVLMLALGAVLIWQWAIPSTSAVAWIVAITVTLLGAFGIFEARAGWCAMRAMGFKTRM